MSKNKDKEFLEEEEITEEMEKEVEEIENKDWTINNEKLKEAVSPENDESCLDKLLKTQADFMNFKARTERDKEDMIFFIKKDIFKKILPSIDDLERIIKTTKKENTNEPIYLWVVALQKKLIWELKKLWIKSFDSIWQEVNPDFHDVMTTVAWKKEWIIIDEFEKWYKIWDRVLRHAKVIVWAWK